jgi:flagellin
MSAVGSILTNTGALTALNSISNTTNMNNTLEGELSSGLSINSPADNPAGYITAQGFTSQLNGLTQAISNANTGVSLLQTAQGAIGQQVGVVQQLNSIAVQAANGTQTSAESQSLQTLASQLTSQVSTIASQTQFNNINLLDGSFTGKQLQVGANEGQTMSLSIGNTNANAIGMYSAGSTTASGTVSAAGKFTAGAVKITGPTGGSGSFTATAGESAAAAAAAANATAATTGVNAVATNTTSYTVKAGTSNNLITFALQAGNGSGGASSGIGKAVSVNATSLSEAISQINQTSNTTGIVASGSGSSLTLTQENGQNITFTAVGTSAASGGTIKAKGATSAVGSGSLQQGQVQFQSSAAFSVGGSGALNGATGNSSLSSLADINVSTTAGANSAINVIKYALASLNNQGGQLGATQQALTANINNLNTTSQNATSALGVVQDANIPAVSTQLTEAEIQAQSGVAALKSSTQLQQSFLSLLP